MSRRLALLIGNTKFCQEDVFPDLSAPEKDVEALSEVLEKYGHFEIQARLVNQDADKIKIAIEDLYSQSTREDLTLLYYSGHGRRDLGGRLFLAASNTQPSHLLATGISASYIRDAQAVSHNRHSVIILDCCYSGAFLTGEKGGSELALEQLEGEATAIMTSSGRVQPSFEGQDLNSIFTKALVEGIRSGEADQDGDGWVKINELYDYVEKRVKQERPEQTPMLNLTARDSTIFIAETPPERLEARKRAQRLQVLFKKAQLAAESKDYRQAGDLLQEIEGQQPGYPGAAALLEWVNQAIEEAEQQISLPSDLQLAIASPLAGVRFGAVQDLKTTLYCGHRRLVQLAEKALQNLLDDDSHRVSSAASEALETYRRSKQPVPVEKPAEIEATPAVSETAVTEKPAPPIPKEQIIAQPAVVEPPKTAAQNEPPSRESVVRPGIFVQIVETLRTRQRLKWVLPLGLLVLIAVISLVVVPRALPGLTALLGTPSVAPSRTSRAIATSTEVSSITIVQPVQIGTPLPVLKQAINLQNVDRLESLARWDTGVVNSIAFAPDGQMLASSGSRGYSIWLSRVSDGSLVRMLQGHTDVVDSVAFSPDGQTLASGSRDNFIWLWRVSDDSMVHMLRGHTDVVDSVAFSPDGQMLASGSWDKTVKLWRVSDGSLVRTLQGHTGRVESVAFSPDGQMLASGSLDNTVKLWQVSDGSLVSTLNGHASAVYSVAFSPDGQMLASGSGDYTVKLWRVSDGSLVQTLQGHTWGVASVAFSPDGQMLASGSWDNTVNLWKVSDGSLVRTLQGHTDKVESVAFSLDGRILASGSDDGTIRLWGVYP